MSREAITNATGQLGEHLDGVGNPCKCTRYSRRDVPVETTVPRPPSVTSVQFEPKQASYKVPQWDASERQQARRKGYQIKVMSEADSGSE
jgi:hypothetical protein